MDALDVSVLVQEINDGDGEDVADVADVAGGDFEGTEAFDVNGDELITTDDIGALAELIFDENQECGEQQPGAFPLGVAPSSVLDFPRLAVAAGELTGIAIANPNPEDAPVTFRAYGETGQMLAETDGVVPGGAQLPALTFDLFPGLPEGTVGWFQASSPAPGLSGFFLDLNFVTFGELDGADLPPRARSIVFNTVQTTGGASTELNVVNPGEDAASVRLTLVSEEGLVERDVELAGKGAVRLDAATFFELDGQEPARMAETSRYVLAVGTASGAPGTDVQTGIFFRPGEEDAHILLFTLDYNQSRLDFDGSDTGDGLPDGVISNLPEDFLVYVRHDASCTSGELGFLVVDAEEAYSSIPEQDLFDVGFTIQNDATGTAFLPLTSPGPQLVDIVSAPQASQVLDDVVSGGILIVP